MDPAVLGFYGKLCGQTLARAHARSGDSVTLASYMGSGESLDRAMADFAETYADQNEQDYARLKHAVDDGEIEATPGL